MCGAGGSSGVLKMHADEIKKLIEAGLPGAAAHVQGEDGVHFDAAVICEAFAGKGMLEQHRMVYATLGDHVAAGTIHALSLRTFTPEEWAARG